MKKILENKELRPVLIYGAVFTIFAALGFITRNNNWFIGNVCMLPVLLML